MNAPANDGPARMSWQARQIAKHADAAARLLGGATLYPEAAPGLRRGALFHLDRLDALTAELREGSR